MPPDRARRNCTRLRGAQRNCSNALWAALFARGDSFELDRKGGRDKAKQGMRKRNRRARKKRRKQRKESRMRASEANTARQDS
eukprot:3397955-Pyramimonas_sp.AAC.1